MTPVRPAWIEKGALVVEMYAGRGIQRPTLGEITEIALVTPTLILTADGRRYNIDTRRPLRGGAFSGTTLMSAHDDTVLTIRARQHVAELAQYVRNLADLPRTTPEEILADLAMIVRRADDSRKAVINLTTADSRAKQESER